MARPSCGYPDRLPAIFAFAGGFIPTGYRWVKSVITYTFDNYSPDMSTNIQSRILREAFDMWSAVVPLIFREVISPTADIHILFAAGAHGPANDPAFDGPGQVLAHAFYPAEGMGGDIHFDVRA